MSQSTRTPLGRHILVEYYDCDPAALNDAALIRNAMEEAARKAGATVISSHVHRFSPQGVSGVTIIAESHLTIHTWPEKGYAAVDIFTCGQELSPHDAVGWMEKVLGSGRVSVVEMKRGFV